MSLVNDMLNDLEQRGRAGQTSVEDLDWLSIRGERESKGKSLGKRVTCVSGDCGACGCSLVVDK